jgi:hypothetical protein
MKTIYVYNSKTRGYDPVEFTKKVAIELHKKMWTDMQKKLGDTPGLYVREGFKRDWCRNHIEGRVNNHCFLCEYTTNENGFVECHRCPVIWPCEANGTMLKYFCEPGHLGFGYTNMPISEILALPEREIEEAG